ncbi:MAG: HEAT-like repeat-containing protein [Deltaproteobacteria bacterium]|nr:HEAT-like repeat-containing protein [Deltaproteobacteria bacterium]
MFGAHDGYLLLYVNKTLFSNDGMIEPPGTPSDMVLQRIVQAVTELAKGMKSASFYPAGHPALLQAVTKIILLFGEIPLPPEGLSIDVSKNALTCRDVPLPAAGNKALADLNRELYLRRAARIIFLPNLQPAEVVSFLKVITRDVDQVLDEGGLERALPNEKVTRIWANRVDYERLTQLLKEEELEEVEPEDFDREPPTSGDDMLVEIPPEEAVTIDTLLARIGKETDPSAYRAHIMEFSRLLLGERAERKIGYSLQAIAIFIRHIETPPGGSAEIGDLARLGIKEVASEELVAHCIGLLKKRGARGLQEIDTMLVAMEMRSVGPLLQALAEEEDLLVRKAIVEIVTRIGRVAVPAILENLNDSRWYMVRNMVNVLGNLGMPDLAPHVAATLSHPDLRVKKEAIKALSRIPHPSAVSALCELCFFPEETVALSATAALASKKETEAVVSLFRRTAAKRFLYPNYRLAHEAIDSLRTIATDDAVTALEEILALRAPWRTEKFRAMKSHALRSISRIKGEKSTEVLEKARRSADPWLRIEAERIIVRRAT